MVTSTRPIQSTNSATLAEILERVLDKGIVIAGDITVQIADIDLLTIRIRLLIASVDKAREIGIDWWQYDRNLSGKARQHDLVAANDELRQRLEQLELRLGAGATNPLPTAVPATVAAAGAGAPP